MKNDFIRKRKYPKCFNTNLDAMEIYDLLTENNLKTLEIQYLINLYTLLLCAVHNIVYENMSQENVRIRFARFFKLNENENWNFLLSLIHQVLNKDMDFFQKNIIPFNRFNILHNNIETYISSILLKHIKK